jgi:hypothetical protein
MVEQEGGTWYLHASADLGIAASLLVLVRT